MPKLGLLGKGKQHATAFSILQSCVVQHLLYLPDEPNRANYTGQDRRFSKLSPGVGGDLNDGDLVERIRDNIKNPVGPPLPAIGPEYT
jgi:hypothetical protein